MGLAAVIIVALTLGALILLGLSATESLASVPSPGSREEVPIGFPARVICALTSEVTRVGLEPTPASGGLAVVWCQRFSGGSIECDGGCVAVLDGPRPRGNARPAGRTPHAA